MSGDGAPTTLADGSALRVAILHASWHPEIMGGLVEGARRGLADCQVDQVLTVNVAGTFELAVAAQRLASHGFDAVVALGVVVRGGTPHFEYVCQAATVGLTEVSVRTGVPVGFGVLTCDTVEQAFERSGLPGSREDKGYEVATAAVTAAVTLHRLTGAPAAGHGPRAVP